MNFILSIIGAGISFGVAIAILVSGFRPGARRPFLSLVFFETGIYFVGEIVSVLGSRAFPALALSLSCAFFIMPSLYLYARSFGDTIGRKAVFHYVPAAVQIPLGLSYAAWLSQPGTIGGIGAAALIGYIEAGQTLQLIVYGRATAALLRKRKGDRNDGWPLRMTVVAVAGFSVFLAAGWLSFLTELIGDLLGGIMLRIPGIDSASLVVSVLLVWTLGLCLLWGRNARTDAGRKRYGGRPFPGNAGMRETLDGLRELLSEERDLSPENAEPRQLARRLGVPYYLLSRAVNEGLGLTVTELVNDYRLEHVKRLLVERPSLGIIDAAFEAGFQSKSTFNDIFRKRVGMNPKDFRETRLRERREKRFTDE